LFLKGIQLLLLLVRQVQSLLEERRQDLARLRTASKPTGTTSARAAGTTVTSTRPTSTRTARTTRATPAGTTGAAPPATIVASVGVRVQFFRQCNQFLLGDHAVLVGVGHVEQPKQTLIGHFLPRQLAVLVLVERHQPREDRRFTKV